MATRAVGGLARPRLVTFDVTGTLLITKLEEHYTEIGLRHGLALEPRQLARSFRSNFKRLAAEHPIYGRHTGLGWENWWRTIVHNVFREQHRGVPESTLDKVARSLIKCYGTSMCWREYPGATELLEYLRAQGLVLGVISNFDERLERVLVDTRLRPYFAFVLTSYEFGMEKPSPSIFAEALRIAKESRGLEIAPKEALHVGDTVDNDYVGARRAGWNALLVNHHNENVDREVVPQHHVFTSLDRLRAHFCQLLGEERTRA